VKGADVFIGVSQKDLLTDDMLKSMAKDPVIFAMANPNPEVSPDRAAKVRPDSIVATGRSDYPNQINNVMCFPFLFRGALDVRASEINEEMKMAAAVALAELTEKEVPEEVKSAFPADKDFTFGRNYIVPTPFDPRLITAVAVATAKAAVETGVAKRPIQDWDAYERSLLQL